MGKCTTHQRTRAIFWILHAVHGWILEKALRLITIVDERLDFFSKLRIGTASLIEEIDPFARWTFQSGLENLFDLLPPLRIHTSSSEPSPVSTRTALLLFAYQFTGTRRVPVSKGIAGELCLITMRKLRSERWMSRAAFLPLACWPSQRDVGVHTAPTSSKSTREITTKSVV